MALPTGFALKLSYGDQEVRWVGTPTQPRAVVADACAILSIKNVSQAVASLDDDEKGIWIVDTPSGPQQMLVVTEPGLYKLISRSRKPAAKAFDKWVRTEVLPCIREHGTYPAPKLADTGNSNVVVARDPEAFAKLEAIGLWCERADGRFEHIDGRLEFIVGKLADVRLNLPTLRRDFSPTIKALYARCAFLKFGGMCPCCGEVRVVDERGEVLSSSRYDHFLARDDASFEAGWIVCDKCNRRLGSASEQRTQARAEFQVFQSRLKTVPKLKRRAAEVNPLQRSLFSKKG